MKKLEALFIDHQMFHSDWQIDTAIIARAGGPTNYGRYKQVLRELINRYRALKNLYCERTLLLLDLEELSQRDERPSRPYDNRRTRIRVIQKRMQIEEQDRVISDTTREFRRFYAQASALKERIGELSDEHRAKLDREMWQVHLKMTAALEIIAAGRLSKNTLELIMACEQSVRLGLLESIKACQGIRDNQGLIEWYEQLEGEQLQPSGQRIDIEMMIMEELKLPSIVLRNQLTNGPEDTRDLYADEDEDGEDEN